MDKNPNVKQLGFLEDGGQMGELMRLKSWEVTELGVPELWPKVLKSTLSLLLHSRFPMILYWGDQFFCFYNDAFSQSLGRDKHPHILGMAGKDALEEMWATLEPMLSEAYKNGKATWDENILSPMIKNGRLEDCYWTFSHSPVKDEKNDIVGVLTILTETTDSVISLKRLEEQEDELKFAIDATDLGIWDYDPVNDKLKSNDRLKTWFGLPTTEAISLQQATNAIVKEDRKRVNDAIAKVFKYESGGKYDVSYTVSNKENGRKRYVRALGRAWFDANKNVYRFNGTLQDNTELQQSIAGLRRNEERFRRLVKEIPVGIVIIGIEAFIIKVVNDMALAIWHKTHEESVDKPLFEVLTEVKDGILPIFNEVISSKKEQEGLEYPFILERNGIKETGYFNFIFKPILVNGEVDEIMLVAFEVTETVRARFNLEQSEKQFKNFVMQSPIAMSILKGYDMRIDMANNAMLNHFWRKTEKEVEGRALLDIFPNLSESKYPEVIRGVLETGLPTAQKESYATLEDEKGTWEFYVDYDYMPLREVDGTVSGVMITTTDVSDRINARKILEDFFKDLETEVEERTEQLREANDRLQLSVYNLRNRNRDLEAFAYVSSHDLQEPLRKIQMFSDRIAERESQHLSENGQRDLNRIFVSAQRMRTLIEDLLAFSRTSADDAKFEYIGLRPLLDEALDNLSDKIAATETLVIADDLCTAKIIPFQIRQLFQNLLENAIKFSAENNSPVIHIGTRKLLGNILEIQGLIKDKAYHEISFSDNGIGFKPDYNERIFEVFQRLHGRSEYKGTGIGLAIVKKIAENHGGTITAEGSLGKGATFRLYLPA